MNSNNFKKCLLLKEAYKHRTKLLLLALIMLVVSCTPGSNNQNEKTEGDEGPSVTITLVKKPFQLADYKGKKLLVAYWATWCPPCIAEVPTLIKLQNKYGGDDFSVVGISTDQSPLLVEKFKNKMNMNYPVYMESDSMKKIFGQIFGLPTLFFVDSSGKIVEKLAGAYPEKNLIKAVEEFINND